MGPCLSTPPPAEEKPLTPQDVVGVLEGRGWTATIVRRTSAPSPSSLSTYGHPQVRRWPRLRQQGHGWPKMLGGVYGIANCRSIKTTQELGDICKEVSAAGHVPSVHGDESSILGCGFCKLWVTGGLRRCWSRHREAQLHRRGGRYGRQGRGWCHREPLRCSLREGRVHQLLPGQDPRARPRRPALHRRRVGRDQVQPRRAQVPCHCGGDCRSLPRASSRRLSSSSPRRRRSPSPPRTSLVSSRAAAGPPRSRRRPSPPSPREG